MNFEEKTIDVRNVYRGKVIELNVHNVKLIDGSSTLREVVNHPGGVAVLAFKDPDSILLVEQFRKPIDKTLLELPAGKLKKGEDPLECGKRELEEETGYKAEKFTYLGKIVTSPGFSDEYIYIFKAEGLYKGTLNLDEDEFIDVMEVPFKEFKKMIHEGKIVDAKTISALYLNSN